MKQKYVNNTMQMLVFLLTLTVTGCATYTEGKAILDDPSAQPQTFEEALITLQKQLTATRDVAALALRTGLITQAVAGNVDTKTRAYRDEVDLIKAAYSGVGDIGNCVLEYPPGSGITVPCQDRSDQILAGLILLQQILEAKQ